jgi:hypothetical protein
MRFLSTALIASALVAVALSMPAAKDGQAPLKSAKTSDVKLKTAKSDESKGKNTELESPIDNLVEPDPLPAIPDHIFATGLVPPPPAAKLREEAADFVTGHRIPAEVLDRVATAERYVDSSDFRKQPKHDDAEKPSQAPLELPEFDFDRPKAASFEFGPSVFSFADEAGFGLANERDETFYGTRDAFLSDDDFGRDFGQY